MDLRNWMFEVRFVIEKAKVRNREALPLNKKGLLYPLFRDKLVSAFMNYILMKKLVRLFLFLFLIPFTGFSQTRIDSVPGTYNRHILNQSGSTLIHPANTDEKLILDKNHCVALTITHTNSKLSLASCGNNEQVYYGIWKTSGDTIIITYSKMENSPSLFTYGWTPDAGIVKLDPPIQQKYFWTGDNYLEPISDSEKAIFYKGELEMVE